MMEQILQSSARKKLIFFAILIFLLTARSVFAETCISPSTHLVKEGPAIASGSNKGLCIETSLAMDVEWKERFDDHDTWVLKNVMSKGAHGFLVVHPKADLVDGVFQLERFDPKWLAAHTQVRLRFKTDTLHWYKDETSLAKGIADNTFSDLLLSIEAIGTEGYEYSLVQGEEAKYAIVYRAVDLADKKYKSLIINKNTVNQWKFNLTQSQVIEYFTHFVNTSDQIRLTQMYDTLRRNCTNQLFRLLQSITAPPGKISEYQVWEASMPVLAPGALLHDHFFVEQIEDLKYDGAPAAPATAPKSTEDCKEEEDCK